MVNERYGISGRVANIREGPRRIRKIINNIKREIKNCYLKIFIKG